MKKFITQEIKTNKDISIDYSKWKKNITSKRYIYFDFNKEIVENIAKKEFKDISNNELRKLIQALFPEYMIGSGLVDGCVIFTIVDGVRIDPPKYWYNNLTSYLNNDKEAKVNRLADEIEDLFKKNEIKYSDGWKKFFKQIRGE